MHISRGGRSRARVEIEAGTEPFVGGESLSTQGADYPATVQGNAGTTNAGGETIRK